MRDEDKTKKQLINELREFRQQDYEFGSPESQHHQIEEKLRWSEERYRVLAENSMDGIYVVILEGFEYVNPAFEKICGYKAKEVCNNEFNFIDLIHPEDRKLIAGREDARKKGKKLPSIYSFRVLTKDGKVKYVEVNTFRLPGEKVRILGMMRDITERKKAEEAIKESEEKFRSLAEQSPNMIFINKKGRVVYVNKKCEEIMGYKREEFYSPDFKFFTLIAPKFRKLVKTSFSSHMKGEEISPYEYALITKEGERIEAINATKLIHYGGESAILGIVTDITERKRAEEELRESETKFRTIFQNVTDVITYVNKYGKILDVNGRVEELFGYKPDELIGKNFVKIGVLRPRDLPRIVKLFRDTIKSGKAKRMVELELKHKNGNNVFVEVGTRFIKKNGKVEGVLNIYRDITERKVAEEHFLRQNAISSAINKVFKEALICKNDRDVAHTCLAVAEELTDSKFGFIGEVSQSGCFDTIALSNPGWHACTISETNAVSMIKDMEIRGLWGQTIKEEKSLIVNDPSSHPESVGTPEGHPSIISFLGVPLKQGNRTIGMIGLANKKSGYEKHDQEAVETLAVSFVEALMRKRAEVKLKESEEQYKDLVEKAGIAILIDDKEGNFKYINEKYAEMFGYPMDEMKKQSIRSIVHPDDIKRVMKYHKLRLEGKRVPSRYEFKGVRKDGSTICLEVDTGALKEGKDIIGTHSYLWDITERKWAEEEIQQSMKNLRKALGGTIKAMALAVETRDPYTSGHQRRVTDLARVIATEMGISKDQIDGVRTAGIIHDLGKICVPAEILSKPTRLSENEFSIIKTHSQVGYEILKQIEFPWPIAQIVLQHHERINGSGYPQGLSGEEILIEARILAVADVVEAMSSHRPYRPALGKDKALEEISRRKGVLYDTEVADACLNLFSKKHFKFR